VTSSHVPPGSEEVRFERFTTFPGNALQVIAAGLFTSYFFFWPVGVCIWLLLSPWAMNVCSWRSLYMFSGIYTAQLFIYKPHLSRGWPYQWLLYGPVVDYALHYHDATMVREGPPLDPSGKYLFAMYPHGVYGMCRLFSGGVRSWRALFPGVTSRWGSFSGAFMLPGIREFSLFAGCLDASKPVMQRAIRWGENLSLLPGGIDEMVLTDGTSKETKLVMLDRKGFVKLAIENGLDIVPGFCFGEKWVHRTVQLPAWIRRMLRPLRLSGTLLKGRGLSFLPFLNPPLSYVWCQPIHVKQQKPVEESYLDKVHCEVMQAVKDVFDRHKARFGYGPDEVLKMVSVAEAKASMGESQRKTD